jgi:hypothetical protein
MVGEYLLYYRNLPMHVIFTCQERDVEIESEEGEVSSMIVPDMSPKPRSVATGCVDFIGRIYKRQVRMVNKKSKKERKVWKTLMLTGPSERYLTKDQSGVLDRITVNPSVPLLIEAAKSLPEEE